LFPAIKTFLESHAFATIEDALHVYNRKLLQHCKVNGAIAFRTGSGGWNIAYMRG
jgi:hypothetical protein